MTSVTTKHFRGLNRCASGIKVRPRQVLLTSLRISLRPSLFSTDTKLHPMTIGPRIQPHFPTSRGFLAWSVGLELLFFVVSVAWALDFQHHPKISYFPALHVPADHVACDGARAALEETKKSYIVL